MNTEHPDAGPARGTLRIYLGAAPGAGKTYAMLDEAHRRQQRGTDVVVAVVDTHDRVHTAEQLAGLEVVPLRQVSHRGTTLEELDVPAVLARRPRLALVDELAHTNAPGSANPKRWQDVEQLLAAGIDVLSTLNVQHLESLNDVVRQITGVVQRETVPDVFVRAATQVELVDITPEALRRRLSHGNVYAPERVDAALSSYFRPGNLTALRELALLWLADQVDAALARYRTDHHITATWEARERVVVAVTGDAESETLVRRASRIASRSGAQLVVAHVVRGDGLAGDAALTMTTVRRLAADLGATVHTVVGDDVPATLLELAASVNATQLVIGASRRSRWARILDEGIGAAVVRGAGTIDVHLVTHEHSHHRPRVAVVAGWPRRALSWVAAVALPPLATAAMTLVQERLGVGGASALFFVVVLAVSLLGGVAPAALSALVSGLLLNYYFTPPTGSFTISEPANLIVILVLLAVAVAVAALVDTAAARTRQARRAAQEAELLTSFAASVLRGADLPALLERVRETFGQRGVSILDADDQPQCTVGEAPPLLRDDADTVVEVDQHTLVLAGPAVAGRDRRVLTAVANQAAALLRQERLAAEADAARGLAAADQLRRSLLSAVSHDLRTPLAAIKAAASSLRSDDVDFSPADTAELLATVEESTDQLTDLVGNLLDSSRLAAGALHPQLRTVYLEEAVHRALLGLRKGAPGRGCAGPEQVVVEVGSVTALADQGLLERVLANLVDNALRYSGGSVVRVQAAEVGTRTLVTVADSGPGVPRGSEDTVFEAFQRLGDHDTTTGVGLGLAVVRGFVEAMGGSVTAGETPGGGLTMVVELARAGVAA